MRQGFYPRSRSFRAVLAMALLAWTALVLGAPRASMAMPQMAMAPHAGHAVTKPAVTHCDGMRMAHAGLHQTATPGQPSGHPACCQGGCHCAMACNAMLVVPRLSFTGFVPQVRLPVVAHSAPASAPATPPLRPPIA